MTIHNAPIQRPAGTGSVSAVFEAGATRTLETGDLEVLTAAGQPWPHEFRQASAGRFHAVSTLTRTAHLEVSHDRMATGVVINGEGLREVVGFALFPGGDVPRYADGRLRSGEMLVLSDQPEFHYASYGPDEWMMVGIQRARLAAWSVETENDHLLDAMTSSRILLRDVRAARVLRERLADVLRASRTSPITVGDEREVLWALASCTATAAGAQPAVTAALAAATRRLIEQTAKDGGSLIDMYDRLGAAPRTVQKAFRLRYGVSPQRYRTVLQLNLSRRLLHRPRGGDAVRRAAAAAGFTHLGRFASTYHAHFDELPSETARRALP